MTNESKILEQLAAISSNMEAMRKKIEAQDEAIKALKGSPLGGTSKMQQSDFATTKNLVSAATVELKRKAEEVAMESWRGRGSNAGRIIGAIIVYFVVMYIVRIISEIADLRYIISYSFVRQLSYLVAFAAAIWFYIKRKRSAQFIESQESAEAVTIKEEKQKLDWESAFGRNWLLIIGALAIIVGMGLFLKYAFDNNWIGSIGRVMIGIVVGLIFMGVGEYGNEKQPKYAHVLTGIGIVVLYFSIYAARNFYTLISSDMALYLMIFITFISAIFAVRYNSKMIAFFSMLGGFATRFMIGAPESDLASLLSYILVLDIGVLAMSMFKRWSDLNLVSFLATCAIFFYSYFEKFRSDYSTAFLFATLFFFVFLFVAVLYNIVRKELTKEHDVILMVLNVAAYVVAARYFLIALEYGNYVGLFVLLLAVFYLLIAYVAYLRNNQDKYLVLSWLGLCLSCITAGIYLQFEKNWITIFWSVEALALLFIGFKVHNENNRAPKLRAFALAIFVMTLIRLIAIETRLPIAEYALIFNRRFYTYAVAIVCVFLAGFLYSRNKEKIEEIEANIMQACVFIANLLVLGIISLEINDYHALKIAELQKQLSPLRGVAVSPFMDNKLYNQTRSISQSRNMWLSIAWTIYAAVLMTVGFVRRSRAVRLLGLAAFVIVICKVFIVDLSGIEQIYRIVSFIFLGLILLAVAFFYHKSFKEEKSIS